MSIRRNTSYFCLFFSTMFHVEQPVESLVMPSMSSSSFPSSMKSMMLFLPDLGRSSLTFQDGGAQNAKRLYVLKYSSTLYYTGGENQRSREKTSLQFTPFRAGRIRGSTLERGKGKKLKKTSVGFNFIEHVCERMIRPDTYLPRGCWE